MSTQGGTGTPLSLVPEDQRQHFRLLELPPELLGILTAEHPPSLQLKSTEGLAGEQGGTAVLCTATQTFNVRQKNSSNTVYVYQPYEPVPDYDGVLLKPALQAMSQSHSTLETVLVAKSTAAACIRSLLPVVATTGRIASTREPLNRAQLFSHIPFSEWECEDAARALAMYEDQTTGQCLLPSAQMKTQVWKVILENMRANAMYASIHLRPHHIELLRDGLEDLPEGLFDAVVRAITVTTTEHLALTSGRLLSFVGVNHLEVEASARSIPTSTFKQSWKTWLPEELRGTIDMSLVSDRATLTEGGKSIRFKDYAADLEAAGDGTGAAESKSAAGTKRKWHEKFRPTKKGG